LNILFLSEQFYPHGGGAELATYLYARLLSQRPGFKITVVTNRFPEEPTFSKTEGFIVYRLPLLRSGSVKYSVLQRFDVLFSNFMNKLMKWADVVYVPRFWFSAIPLAKAFRKPVITHLHDYIPICPLAVLYDSRKNDICRRRRICDPGCIYAFERKKRTLRESIGSTVLNLGAWNYLRKAVELSDTIICVSKAQRDILVEHTPQLGPISEVIYNPLPDLTVIPMEGEGFGYFGGTSIRKGFQVLMKALAIVNDNSIQRVAVHATKFDGITEPLASTLKQQGFLPHGKLSEGEYKKMYRRVRTVIAPSIWPEPWPYVVVEAIVNGRLVIAANVGGMPEQLKGCRGATLLEPGNYKGLAEAIVSTGKLGGEVVADLGYHNRESFLKRYSTENTIEAFMRTCESLIGQSS
jgi:glycosyltransferase involved in cell wall biosynthesis